MQSARSKLDHDHKVREQALLLLSQGYNVAARLEGWFDDPEPIRGYSPDIVAQKQNEHLIVEVKKGPIDWPKIVALHEFAEEHPEWTLQIIELP